MKTAFVSILVAGVCASAVSAAEQHAQKVVDQSEKRSTAVEIIDRLIKYDSSTAEANVADLRDAAKEVMRLTPRNELVKSTLEKAIAETEQTRAEPNVQELWSAFREVREILTFRPVLEAPTPEGFPKWTPVGEIQIKKYPVYRIARTEMTSREDAAFWTLFNHIEANKIAMTAPVEMSYRASGSEDHRSIDMAFLYRNTQIGETGSSGTVNVIDVSANTAVSVGVRGEITSRAVGAAHSRLKDWLADHSDRYEANGDLRVLGYNSPMIPVGKRYFEVQIPVREK